MATVRKIDNMKRQWGKRLRDARITAGYKDAEAMAAELRIGAPAYRRYERGEATPRIDILEMIADRTGRSLDFLLLGRSDRPR